MNAHASKSGYAFYRVEYTFTVAEDRMPTKPAASLVAGRSISNYEIIHAASADHALAQFHRLLQQVSQSNVSRECERPKLRFNEYRITRFGIPYKDASGVEQMHAFDVPRGANPDARKRTPQEKADARAHEHKTDVMPLFDEAAGQGTSRPIVDMEVR